MKLYLLGAWIALSSVPAFAIPFMLDFKWTPVAGVNGNSADFFDFRFISPTGELKLSQLSVTLGSGMIYDTTNSGPGYLTWGAYTFDDGGSGATQTSPALGEGTGGNRTISWDFATFTNGVTISYGADVDESGTCAQGISGVLCRLNVDNIAPSGFVSRGGVDIAFTVDFVNGYPGASFIPPANSQSWSNSLLSASTSYSGDVYAPEPASWTLGLCGLAACAFCRRRLP